MQNLQPCKAVPLHHHPHFPPSLLCPQTKPQSCLSLLIPPLPSLKLPPPRSSFPPTPSPHPATSAKRSSLPFPSAAKQPSPPPASSSLASAASAPLHASTSPH